MKKTATLPTWAPRVKPHLIRCLYESDARGIYDEELLDEVGWGLYGRCESFIKAMQATQGNAFCPVCGGTVLHGRRAKETLHCTTCGWECTWKDYYKTIQNQQLNGGPEVVDLFQDFVNQLPGAHKPPEKMLLIDGLIHGFHHFLRSGRPRRPVGVNLIDGNLQWVIEFLDELTYGPGSTPGLLQNQVEWGAKINHRPAGKAKKLIRATTRSEGPEIPTP